MKKKILAFLLVFALVCQMAMPTMAASLITGVRPEDGVTEDQPFAPGTGTSNNFRIPCLVTLDDGTIVAGCDARWSWQMDGGGLDTIVSYSKDNGKTWNYTFANYLGDNGNVANYDSTAFIDPAMATDGKTVYMIADLLPAGVALNGARYAPKTGHTGYDANHNLVLAAATASVDGDDDSSLRAAAAFDYHLEKIEGAADDAASYYQLKDASGNDVEGYTIDAFFNIKGENVDTNLFCGDSPYFPYPTNFLYMTKSEDGGKTWSVPTMIDVKKASEQTLLVGPGRGMVTSTGRLLFTAYEFTNTDIASCAFYSDDNGKTWTRGASVDSWSSEAVVTEAEGKLYMFTRHGGYYVSEDWGATWSAKKEMGITYNLNCQLTAITYSEKIDGKTAILFAAPSNTSSRSQGKIFVGLVQEDGSLDWAYEYLVTDGSYAYSCIDELSNGNLGLLYEGGSITYTEISLDEIQGKIKKVEVAAGTTYTEENPEATAAPVITTQPDTKIVTVTSELVHESSHHVVHAYKGGGTAGSPETFFNSSVDTVCSLEDAIFTLTQSGDGWTVYNETKDTYLDISGAGDYYGAETVLTVEKTEDGCFRFKRSSGHYAIFYIPNMNFDRWSTLALDNANLGYNFTVLKAKDSVAEGDIIPGYEKVTELENGGKYLLTYVYGSGEDASVIILYPVHPQASQTKLYGGLQEVNKSVMTITGVAKGTTTAVVDGVEYIITVTSAEIPVEKLTATTINHETSSTTEGAGSLVLDGNTGTMWHTEWNPVAYSGRDDHWIQLEIDGDYMIDGLRYLPRQSGTNGIITEYKIEVSNDGETWTEVAAGEWAGNSEWKVVEFEESVAAKYVKLISVASMSDQADRGNEFTSAAEIRLLGSVATEPPVEECKHENTEAAGEAKEATCTETGLTAGEKCSDCGTVLTAQEEIPALGHEFPEEWTVVEAATTEKAGKEERQCTRCDVKEEREIPKLEETVTPGEITAFDSAVLAENAKANSEQLPAAWTDDGGAAWAFTDNDSWWHSRYDNWDQKGDHEIGTATGDGKPTDSNPIWIQTGFDKEWMVDHITYLSRPNGHGIINKYAVSVANLADPTAEPTDADFTVVKEGNLELAITEQTIQLDEAVAATHVRITVYSTYQGGSNGDGHVAAKRIMIYGYDAQTVDPETCEHTNTKVVGEKAATCTEEGYTGDTVCAACGTEIAKGTAIPAAGHTEVTVAGKEATCSETGLTEGKKCSVCDTVTVAQSVIEKKAHTEVTVAGKEATCTETGLTEGKKCSVCGEVLKAQEVIAKKAHTAEAVAGKEATCTETGLTEGSKCSVCGEILKAQEVISAKGHSWSEWTVVEAATTEKAGKEERTCSVCGEKESREIAKLDPVTPEEPAAPPVVGEADQVELSKASHNALSLKWNEVEAAAAYKVEVYAADNMETPAAVYENVAATELTVSGLAAKTEYVVKVYAVNKHGVSETAMEIQAVTAAKPAAPSQPTTPATPAAPATGDNAQILTWIAVAFVMAAGMCTAFFRRRAK